MDKIQEVRKTLGTSVAKLDDDELSEDVTKFDLLAECILDIAEKDLFGNKTLSELISGTVSFNTNKP